MTAILGDAGFINKGLDFKKRLNSMDELAGR
jgi:hypothetical protein